MAANGGMSVHPGTERFYGDSKEVEKDPVKEIVLSSVPVENEGKGSKGS